MEIMRILSFINIFIFLSFNLKDSFNNSFNLISDNNNALIWNRLLSDSKNSLSISNTSTSNVTKTTDKNHDQVTKSGTDSDRTERNSYEPETEEKSLISEGSDSKVIQYHVDVSINTDQSNLSDETSSNTNRTTDQDTINPDIYISYDVTNIPDSHPSSSFLFDSGSSSSVEQKGSEQLEMNDEIKNNDKASQTKNKDEHIRLIDRIEREADISEHFQNTMELEKKKKHLHNLNNLSSDSIYNKNHEEINENSKLIEDDLIPNYNEDIIRTPDNHDEYGKEEMHHDHSHDISQNLNNKDIL